jgi:adenylate cyclase
MTSVAPSLLVVDDNEDNRFTLTQRLKREGYDNVVCAVNGREALDLMTSRSFDLVLLDITMPELDGFEVLERVKSDTTLRDTPVVMISAIDEIESVGAAFGLGRTTISASPSILFFSGRASLPAWRRSACVTRRRPTRT